MGGGDDWVKNGDGTYTAKAGDSAATLARDADITFDKANEIVQNQLGKNYVDTDGVEKSNVKVDDVVAVPEQVECFCNEQQQIAEKEDATIKVEIEIENSVSAKNKLEKQVDSIKQEWHNFMNNPINKHERYGNEPSSGMGSYRTYKGTQIEKNLKRKKKKADSVNNVIQNLKKKLDGLNN
jgi:signal transduction protein with GAF and PtsI domain